MTKCPAMSAVASAAVQLNLRHQLGGVLPCQGGDLAKSRVAGGERALMLAALQLPVDRHLHLIRTFTRWSRRVMTATQAAFCWR